MSEIRQWLYLGGVESVNKDFLAANNIKNILTVDTVPVDNSLFPHISIKFLQITDEIDSVLLPELPDLVTWIQENLQKKESTLVHCRHGVSRSASVVAATIMALDNVDPETALDKIKAVRPQISPNLGFLRQLKLWRQLNFNLGAESSNYYYFLAAHGKPAFKPVSQESSEFGYKCSKCRKILFFSDDLIPHDIGWWENLKGHVPCSKGLVIVPLQWMEMSERRGKLLCAYCSNKLGTIGLEGTVTCPCTTVVPKVALVIPSKVDRFKVTRS